MPDNPKAFPSQPWPDKESGMSLRDYFAAKAMQGILSSNECGIGHHPKSVCEWAYSIADEMLKVREQSNLKTTKTDENSNNATW
jgi:hypothetical protein